MGTKVVVAPDKFKGTLGAEFVARAIGEGVKKALPGAEVVLVPVADGGEGTVDALIAATGGERQAVVVTDPLGKPVKAEIGVLPNRTAIIEMAKASGLVLVPPEKRDPTVTTTFGTGELIEAALDLECARFIIGIGGSATCDAGIGAAQALGVKILKEDGSPVGFGGAELIKIARIDISSIDPRSRGKQFLVASDVNNPLFGTRGAAHIFAPQKGAGPEQVILLDQGLIHFSRVVKRDLGIDISEIPGAGAAGGLGAGLVAFLGATIRPGADLIIEIVGLRDKLQGADLVITGEGQIDRQSAYGKAPVAVAQAARQLSIKTAAIAGRLGDGYQEVQAAGIGRIYSLEQIAGSAEEAMQNPIPYIELAAVMAVKEFLPGGRL
ncbi:MAG TPA: glycerate kinase [Anaerolineae bacterium]|jgi:glycerate kinase|nr:glycerate kinase [Anaerolineae bacterium]